MTLFNYENNAKRRTELQAQMNAPDFWDDPTSANKVVTEVKGISSKLDPLDNLTSDIEDLSILWEMAEEADDQDSREEADGQINELEARIGKLKTLSLLNGKFDNNNCYLSIYSREGGTEAQDWTEMMFRMYLYYCEQVGWKVEELDRTYGEEAGLKDVTLHIQGPMAYGYLSAERGTHRLARVSPFNAQGKRQTSFAAVDVTPEFEDTGGIEIPDSDLDITFFARSSGPGGQNVNKLATAIRLTHKPSGITVVCSNHRKQEQNRKQAMAILRAKLEMIEEEKRQAEQNEATGGKVEMGWGTQIRSYVFYDNRVKDHRTNYEQSNPQRVMDGDIHGFIESELQRRAKSKA